MPTILRSCSSHFYSHRFPLCDAKIPDLLAPPFSLLLIDDAWQLIIIQQVERRCVNERRGLKRRPIHQHRGCGYCIVIGGVSTWRQRRATRGERAHANADQSTFRNQWNDEGTGTTGSSLQNSRVGCDDLYLALGPRGGEIIQQVLSPSCTGIWGFADVPAPTVSTSWQGLGDRWPCLPPWRIYDTL
mgnify:CR=1 FL=1